ncbi:MAG: tRNA (adenosine(37)-N6)-dimethylallyltransferase MiaA [Burkholderiales bacterium]
MSRVAFALLGPTASGKSRLAMQLAAKLPLEIVSMDSGQVYRGMDVGTAKPSPAERGRVPHHLIDLLEPTESYSAARFRADAMHSIEGILSRARLPLLVGGTMLYYRTLAEGIDDLPAAQPALRAAIEADAASRGWPALHAELAKVDPAAAKRLATNDAQRIQRALEVYRVTGKPISALQRKEKSPLPFELKAFAIVPGDRVELHRRIAERFDQMLKDGLVEEVRELRRRHALHAALPSMRCVGYRQVWRYLEGGCSQAEMRDLGVAATRQLAKRQLTWLRSLPALQPAKLLAQALTRA